MTAGVLDPTDSGKGIVSANSEVQAQLERVEGRWSPAFQKMKPVPMIAAPMRNLRRDGFISISLAEVTGFRDLITEVNAQFLPFCKDVLLAEKAGMAEQFLA